MAAGGGGTGCACDDGLNVRGAFCDQELVCSAQKSVKGERDAAACITYSSESKVTCACTVPRRIAVFAHKVTWPDYLNTL